MWRRDARRGLRGVRRLQGPLRHRPRRGRWPDPRVLDEPGRAPAATPDPKGAPGGSVEVGLREWLDGLPARAWPLVRRLRHPRDQGPAPAGLGRTQRHARRTTARVPTRHRPRRASTSSTWHGPLAEGGFEGGAWARSAAASLPSTVASGPDADPERRRADDDHELERAGRDGGAGLSGYVPPVEDLVDRVLGLREALDGTRPVLLGVTGEPGAGKSTFAASLVANLLEAGPAVLVPMDGFHLANVALAALGRSDRKGAIDTFDGAGFAALLARLRAGGPDTVWAPVYDRSIEESVANAIPVPAGTEVVVTEGNYLLVDEGPWDAVRGLLDEVWAVGSTRSCGPSGSSLATSGSARSRSTPPPGWSPSTSTTPRSSGPPFDPCRPRRPVAVASRTPGGRRDRAERPAAGVRPHTMRGVSEARFGSLVARGVSAVTHDAADLTSGFWVVVVTFEGHLTAVRMEEVAREDAPAAARHARGRRCRASGARAWTVRPTSRGSRRSAHGSRRARSTRSTSAGSSSTTSLSTPPSQRSARASPSATRRRTPRPSTCRRPGSRSPARRRRPTSCGAAPG